MVLDLAALAAALLDGRTSPYPVGDAERAEVTALIHAKAAALMKSEDITRHDALTRVMRLKSPLSSNRNNLSSNSPASCGASDALRADAPSV